MYNYVVKINDINHMNKNSLLKILTDIGLSENEAGIYITNLSLGPSTILAISRASGIKRTTVYTIIESLKQKGLISIETKGFKQLFVAENPEKLASVLETKKKDLVKLMPEFSALYNLKGGESVMKYYEGLAGIKNVYESLLKEVQPHDDYLVISHQEEWYDLDRKYFQNFIERRSKLPVKTRMLLQDSPIARKFKERELNYNFEVKILPKNTKLVTNLVIIPKKVVIHQLIPPVSAIVIENRSTIQMHQQLFEIIWESIE